MALFVALLVGLLEFVVVALIILLIAFIVVEIIRFVLSIFWPTASPTRFPLPPYARIIYAIAVIAILGAAIAALTGHPYLVF